MTESCSKFSNPAIPLNLNIKIEDEAAALDSFTFTDYYNRLSLLAVNRYKWVGLPESCNALALEKWLFNYGRACFIYDKDLGYINLKCTGSDSKNIYEMPIKYNCYSGEYEKEKELDEIVIVRNNAFEIPANDTISLYAWKLANAERTIDVNLQGQKTPVIILCDEKQRLTMQNLYMKYTGNVPFIFGDKNLDISAVKTLSTNAPFVADKIQQYKRNVWAECMTFLGINNVEHEKKERLTDDEVNSNNVLIDNNAEIGLAWRQAAAEEANKKLWKNKYNAKVELRTLSELETIVNGGGENGEIHN